MRRLYEICHHRVYRLMVRMVGLQDAADLTQQVFLQVFRKMDQFAGYSRFETWLYRLATNEALQHLRKGRLRKHESLTPEPMERGPGGDEISQKKELLDLAMERVDLELRSIFLLREVEGLSYRDIADALGIPEGTVGSRLNRARRELQRHLTDLGWEA
jgi:RNA polymerase sigma-70 factor (ECF subfamily)